MARDKRSTLWKDLGTEALARALEMRGKISSELKSPFWQAVIARPRQLLYWAETLSPELTRRALSYASVARLPGATGPDFQISDWSADGLTATVAAPEGSELALSELTIFAERILLLYWERHFLSPSDQLAFKSVRVEKLGSWRGPLQLRLGMSHLVREKLRISSARTQGESLVDVSIPVFNDQSLQVGDCAFEVAWVSRPALG